MKNTAQVLNGHHTLGNNQVELLASLSLEVPAVLSTEQLTHLLRAARDSAEATYHPVLTPLVLKAIATIEVEQLLN